MSFMGEIGDVGAADLLYLLRLKQQTGRLAINTAGDQVVISLVRGRLTSVTSSDPMLRLGRMLIRLGFMTPESLRRSLQLQDQSNGDTLGKVLLDNELVTREQLTRCVEEQCIEILAKVIASDVGMFAFTPDPNPPTSTFDSPLNTDRIVLEATRRTDELAKLSSLMPDSDTPLLISADLDALADSLSDTEVFIAATLQTAPATFNEIAARLSIDPNQLWKTILSMRERGLLMAGSPAKAST